VCRLLQQKGQEQENQQQKKETLQRRESTGGKYEHCIAHVKDEEIALFISMLASGQILLNRSRKNDRRKHTWKKEV